MFFESAVAKPYTAEDTSVLGCDTVFGDYFLRALRSIKLKREID